MIFSSGKTALPSRRYLVNLADSLHSKEQFNYQDVSSLTSLCPPNLNYYATKFTQFSALKFLKPLRSESITL